MKYLTKDQNEILSDLAASEEVRGALTNLIAESGDEAIKNYKVDTKKLAKKSKKKGFILGAACAAGAISVSNHWTEIKSFIEEKTGKKDYRDIDLTDENEI